jgi:peptidoglycan/xylan/chitin deacetylase (PgdA/CDA1 family)
MKEDGHLIGNHTYSHVILNEVSWDAALLEINKTNEIIKEVVGVLPTYIRPPYGGWSEDMLYEVNLTPVFWNVDPMDWNSSDVGEIVKSVVDNVKDGDIILMHDIFDSSVAAALEIVDELQKQGFMFVTVEEILIS